jgi:hypothetical protein
LPIAKNKTKMFYPDEMRLKIDNYRVNFREREKEYKKEYRKQ